jgi:ATP-dependent RNA helicase RhlE
MFSATIPPELNKVASEALHDPRRVALAPSSRPAAGITQAIYPVPRHLKTDLLDQVLLKPEVGSAIVFTRTKHGAERLMHQLKRRGHAVAALHGDRTQGQRERALSDLKRGRVQVLVATDIASRGIDVDDISHVINYDVPHTPEDYVHRIGRTGRVQAVGDAFTLMSPEEKKDVAQIERFLGTAIPRVEIPTFDYKRTSDPKAHSGSEGREGRGGRESGRSHGQGSGSPHARGGPSLGPAQPPAPSHGRRPTRGGTGRRGRRM